MAISATRARAARAKDVRGRAKEVAKGSSSKLAAAKAPQLNWAAVKTAQKIYADENIEIFQRNGSSRFACITFNEMAFTADGHSFWGERLFNELDLSGLGIVAKRPNWFPEVSIRRALQDCPRFGMPAIAYGYSMGAYAALKWGAAFGAECSLGYSPQFSIVPEDTGGQDKRYLSYFVPELNRGMAISRSDLACARNYVVVDPTHPIDMLNLRLIEANRHVVRLYARNLAHETIYAGKGSEIACSMLKAALRDDVGLCRQIIRSTAKAAPIYKRELLRRLCEHRKYAQFLKLATHAADELRGDAAYHRIMADYYRLNKALPEAIDSISRAIEISPSNSAFVGCRISLLLQAGRVEEAATEAASAIKRWPAALPVQAAYLSALHAAGLQEQAKEYLGENQMLRAQPFMRSLVRDIDRISALVTAVTGRGAFSS